jgi:hypothetical protein
MNVCSGLEVPTRNEDLTLNQLKQKYAWDLIPNA